MKNHPIVDDAKTLKRLTTENQKELLVLCQNKIYDLKDRFEVWKEHAIKRDHPWVLEEFFGCDANGPELMRCYSDILEYKGEVQSYENILDYCKDMAQEEHGFEGKDFFEFELYREVVEWMIQNNFGSFKFDW